MFNPFSYRPNSPYPTEFTSDEDVLDWEDNWLSNAMAYGSEQLMPSMCSRPSHWSSIVANYFWTDCACCLVFRGAIVGAIIGGATVATVAYFI